jgi:hypothetical protein
MSRLNNSNSTCNVIIELIGKKYDKLIDELTTRFEKFGRIINIEKAEENNKKSSKAIVIMINYLAEEDNIVIQDYNIVLEIWVF